MSGLAVKVAEVHELRALVGRLSMSEAVLLLQEFPDDGDQVTEMRWNIVADEINRRRRERRLAREAT